MRRFEDISYNQIMEKLFSMRGGEYGEILCEWLHRYREGCRDDLEKLVDQPINVALSQGRIDAAKSLLSILTPPTHPVPPRGA